jgi:AcrR family transcriptional regulator
MRKSEQTRAFIVAKTAAIFNKKGVNGTSLQDMTAATGLTKGAIYGNFDNKDAVAVAAFDYNVQAILGEIRIRQARESSYRGKLMALLQFYRELGERTDQHYGCPIANTLTESDDTHPTLLTEARKSVEFWQKSGEKLIEKGKAAGEFKSEADADKLVRLLFVLIEGGMLLSKGTGEKRYLHQAIDQAEILLNQQLFL